LAKILCLDGNFDKALGIYEYALQKIPADHPGRNVCLSFFLSFIFSVSSQIPWTYSFRTISYSSFSLANYIQVLTQLLKKLQDKLAGGNRRDPFTVLPLEIAELTLRRFSFKQIV
jgi:F-box/TPR repeat protein Pof3